MLRSTGEKQRNELIAMIQKVVSVESPTESEQAAVGIRLDGLQ